MDSIESSVEITFKSIKYEINLNANENQLILEIQNVETAESWKGSFEKNKIEDLTRKTGNFKSFPIFVNMLQSALNNESSTVTLDLLTYNDLENLRSKSSLNNSNASTLSRNSTQYQSKNNKRFLIMTYNVEFDRINYPLQLRYQGVLDTTKLLETIRILKDEIKFLQSNRTNDNEFYDYKKELKRLELENQTLRKENESLEMKLMKLNSSNNNNNNNMENSSNNHQMENRTIKELNALKKMMKTFEEDALREKNLYLKQMIKKNEEINQLKDQMNKMIDNERNMVNKLRALKDLEQARSSKLNSRSSSKESIQRINYVPVAQRQHKSRLQSNSLDRFSKTSSRYQSNSLDRFSRASRNSSRKVSISPASSTRSNSKRFDPTEYCRMKKIKLEEINSSKKRESLAKMNIYSDDSSSRTNLNTKPVRANSKNRSRVSETNFNYEYLNSSVSMNQSNDENSYNPIHQHQRHHQQQQRQLHKRNNSNTYNREQELKEINDKLQSLHSLFVK